MTLSVYAAALYGALNLSTLPLSLNILFSNLTSEKSSTDTTLVSVSLKPVIFWKLLFAPKLSIFNVYLYAPEVVS